MPPAALPVPGLGFLALLVLFSASNPKSRQHRGLLPIVQHASTSPATSNVISLKIINSSVLKDFGPVASPQTKSSKAVSDPNRCLGSGRSGPLSPQGLIVHSLSLPVATTIAPRVEIRPCLCALRLFDIPVEIFTVIAEHIPLYYTPHTLLSFALTSRTSHNITLPILYAHLILRSERNTLSVLRGILGNSPQGSFVRGIYIHSPLSSEVGAATRDGTSDVVDVVRTLERLIKSGFIPLLHTLELHLDGYSWCLDSNGDPFDDFGELRASFWKHSRLDAPRFAPGHVEQERNALLLKSVNNLASHLRHLDLAPNSTADEGMDLGPYWSLHFPHIHSITLSGLDSYDTSKAMSFWQRHPSLEYINLSFCEGTPMFCDNIDTIEGFLPKLRHLTAPYADIRRLTSLLPGLVSMSVHNTVNAQVPYLLRSVLSGGLPNLRSLNVEQSPEPEGSLKRIEAVRW
ncbi:hypothetical protein BKA70DRAFT_1226056 [Coprinopsis sp. MPI-PUGE-AT-0042]|nr:hypothetical protein BKA70DRAFT_1226056 [Coprinopsis sp. MPI-PUGE-AT-0042]